MLDVKIVSDQRDQHERGRKKGTNLRSESTVDRRVCTNDQRGDERQSTKHEMRKKGQ